MRRCFAMVLLALCFPAVSISAQPQEQKKEIEKYCAFIYTSQDLASDIQKAVDESRSRGLGKDMLDAGIKALKGLGAGYVTSFVDMGVNALGQMITKTARDKKAWEEMVKKENSFSIAINTVSEISDFYDSISSDGPMDPKGMKFDGIGCIKMTGADTTFFLSCHINRDRINRIVEHSKFELVLDTLIVSPYHSDLPNSRLGIPFSFEERDNFTMTLTMQLLSSWMDQLPQMNRDQLLGEFVITIPVRKEELGADGYLRYVRGKSEAPKYAVVGESFIVPRSYMSVRESDGRMRYSWGTGEYKLSIMLNESCELTQAFRKNWKKDYKRHKTLEAKTSLWKRFVQVVTTPKWDELTRSWVVTTLKAPADVLSDEIIKELDLGTPTPAGNPKGGK